MKGLIERYPEAEGEVRCRSAASDLKYELSTIENMGYVEYFLIVWDFINYAKENHIMVGPGRGSAAGSDRSIYHCVSPISIRSNTG